MSNDWVDFKQVKATVSIEMALQHYDIELRRVNAFTLRGKCPLPTHTGNSDNSFGVNAQKNAWACHAGSCVANRDGRTGGNVLDFVAVMENCTIRDAALKLQNWFSVAASNDRPKNYVPSRDRNGKKELVAEKKVEQPAPAPVPPSTPTDKQDDDTDDDDDGTINQPLAFSLKSVDPSHEYLRGCSDLCLTLIFPVKFPPT